jgi:hypothetical protein
MPQLQIQAGCFGSLFKSNFRHKPESDRSSSVQHNSKQRKRNPSTPNSLFEEYDEPEVSSIHFYCLKTAIRHFTKLPCRYFNPACDFSYAEHSGWWSTLQDPPSYSELPSKSLESHADVIKTIENKLDELSPELRKLSLQIHGEACILVPL